MINMVTSKDIDKEIHDLKNKEKELQSELIRLKKSECMKCRYIYLDCDRIFFPIEETDDGISGLSICIYGPRNSNLSYWIKIEVIHSYETNFESIFNHPIDRFSVFLDDEGFIKRMYNKIKSFDKSKLIKRTFDGTYINI